MLQQVQQPPWIPRAKPLLRFGSHGPPGEVSESQMALKEAEVAA